MESIPFDAAAASQPDASNVWTSAMPFAVGAFGAATLMCNVGKSAVELMQSIVNLRRGQNAQPVAAPDPPVTHTTQVYVSIRTSAPSQELTHLCAAFRIVNLVNDYNRNHVTHANPNARSPLAIETNPNLVEERALVAPVIQDLISEPQRSPRRRPFPLKYVLQNSVLVRDVFSHLTLHDAIALASAFRMGRDVVRRHYRIKTRFIIDNAPAVVSMDVLYRLGWKTDFSCAHCEDQNLRLQYLLQQHEMVKWLKYYRHGEDDKKDVRFLCPTCHSDWKQAIFAAQFHLYPHLLAPQIPLFSTNMDIRQGAVRKALRLFEKIPKLLGSVPMEKVRRLVQVYPDTS